VSWSKVMPWAAAGPICNQKAPKNPSANANARPRPGDKSLRPWNLRRGLQKINA
jgi:hypothetical protein